MSNINPIANALNYCDTSSDSDSYDSCDDSDSYDNIIFKDADSDSDSEPDSDINAVTNLKSNCTCKTKHVFRNTSKIKHIFASVNNYTFSPWPEFLHKHFKNTSLTLRSLIFNSQWNDFFDIIESRSYYHKIAAILTDCVVQKSQTIVPYPELLFNSLNVLSPDKIKVVFIGQDPYINITQIHNKQIPQAMGFSFSVPLHYPKPPSLTNIFKNLLQFNHIKKLPETGCLAPWILQGCFMINAALTTLHGKSNSHRELWKEFTFDLLNYLNEKCDKLVFLAWGASAHRLCLNIDPNCHCIITSSHPSPLSVSNTFTGYTYGLNSKNRSRATYPTFQNLDHFGRANEYLKTHNKRTIIWDML